MPLPGREIERTAELIGLFGSATRLRILQALESTAELSATELANRLGISISTVAQHLTKLRGVGLILPRRDGAKVHYRLTGDPPIVDLRERLSALAGLR